MPLQMDQFFMSLSMTDLYKFTQYFLLSFFHCFKANLQNQLIHHHLKWLKTDGVCCLIKTSKEASFSLLSHLFVNFCQSDQSNQVARHFTKKSLLPCHFLIHSSLVNKLLFLDHHLTQLWIEIVPCVSCFLS
jgi:hypothetical protein